MNVGDHLLVLLLYVQFSYAVEDASLVSSECLKRNYTRFSCAKAFCPPWMRCISGVCVCKVPYQCPPTGKSVCGMDGIYYPSLCKALTHSCRDNTPTFSHFGHSCHENDVFQVHLKESDGKEVVQVKSQKGDVLVCGTESWDMAAANVVCRHKKNQLSGALAAGKIKLNHIYEGEQLPHECMSVRCTGSEFSLAECTLYQPQPVTPDTNIAWVYCYNQENADDECSEFHCVNGKCISWEHTCDGLDHCGDNSDEMCCKGCRGGAFHCKSEVCIPARAVRDGIRNCLGGEDEVITQIQTPDPKPAPTEAPWSDLTDEIRRLRNLTESQLQCGIPNMEYVDKREQTFYHRRKRVAGGQEALPTQIQWQVALKKNGRLHCGGVYLGGCWVLTSARCARSNPQAYRVLLSLWHIFKVQGTTDIALVERIIPHQDYNPFTHQNDIALLQLEKHHWSVECIPPNPAVRPVCVPWSTLQFRPGDTCTVSGWGKDRDGYSSHVLKLANMTLNDSCQSYYKDRFYEGMECAGDPEGGAATCHGDSGGPLVCKDAGGTSYVWGIVSFDENCGKSGDPDLFTKVAHYFEWIRLHTGWSAVTKYN